MRRTKIICTLGPAVDSDEMVEKLILNGMNCARLNFSHGTHKEHKERIERVRRVCNRLGATVALLMDTKGPEIRLRDFEDKFITVEAGDILTLDDRQDEPGNRSRVAISYPDLIGQISPGTHVLIDDGRIDLEVISVSGDMRSMDCRVINGGKVSNRKGINVPDLDVEMPFLSPADESDIMFGIEQNLDYVAASFVRSAQDVKELRKFMNDHGGSNMRIISKIENRQGVRNVESILEASEGAMVARGDLGVEIPFRNIPTIQKSIIDKCAQHGKLVVTATQMLESMTHSPRPTRAEVSDVANAIFDGTSAIMLSGETAAGEFPVEAVRTMAEIAETSEKSANYNNRFAQDRLKLNKSIRNAVCASAYSAARFLHAAAIVVVTRRGNTARHLSDFRPECPIIAITMDPMSKCQEALSWGIFPMSSQYQDSADKLFDHAQKRALESGIVKKGDTIVVVTASDTNADMGNDVMRITKL